MELTTRKIDSGALTVSIAGALNIYEASGFKDRLVAVFGEISQCVSLEVDLSGVAEMDTSGVQLLVLARREAQERGKGFRITARSAAAQAAIELYNLRESLG